MSLSKRTLRIVAVAPLAMLVALGVWIGLAGVSARSPLDAPSLPTITFNGDHGPEALRSDPSRQTLVILFRSDCRHCVNEFDEIEPHVDRLADKQLYLLTTEDSLDLMAIRSRWPRLAAAGNVTWGSIERKAVVRYFGVKVTPSLLLYDRHGRLLRKWRGETKLQALLDGSGELGASCETASAVRAPCALPTTSVAPAQPPTDDVR